VQALLGHARLNTSEIYAEKNEKLMRRVAAEVG
jgi:site-specific recombinase XerD